MLRPAVKTTGNGASVDAATVEGFGYEWTKFDQSDVDMAEMQALFDLYFSSFPWDSLPENPIGFDLGCGSGRWARLASPRVGRLVCIDASLEALAVTGRNAPDCLLLLASAGALPVRTASLDFGYSLGVLHHIPEPLRGLTDAVQALKPGAPFLVYLYYAFDNRTPWFRALWKATDLVRKGVSRQSPRVRSAISQVLAVSVYLPLARSAALLERLGRDVEALPLAAYRHRSLYTMRTDALDRFGTRLEHRFTKREVVALMEGAGLERITVSDDMPYWCAVGFKPLGQVGP